MSKKQIKIEKTRPIPIPKPTIWQKNIPITELAKKTLLEKKHPKAQKIQLFRQRGTDPFVTSVHDCYSKTTWTVRNLARVPIQQD